MRYMNDTAAQRGTWARHGKPSVIRYYGRTKDEPCLESNVATVEALPGGRIRITNLTDGYTETIGAASLFYAAPTTDEEIKADTTATLQRVARERQEARESVKAPEHGYGAAVARMIVREGGYTIREASDMAIEYQAMIDEGERFGSNVDYVAWKIMDAHSKAKAALLAEIEEWQRESHADGDGLMLPDRYSLATLQALWDAGLVVPGGKTTGNGGKLGWYSVRMIDAAHEEALAMDELASEVLAETPKSITGHQASSHSRRGAECRICGHPVADHEEVDVTESLSVAYWTGTVYGATPDEARIQVVKARLATVPVTPGCECPTPDAFHYRGCPVMVAEYKGFTSDRVEITDGLAVWDYNLDPGYVALSQLGSDGWFNVVRNPGDRNGSLMNAERVCVRHPYSGQLAFEALARMAVCVDCGAPSVRVSPGDGTEDKPRCERHARPVRTADDSSLMNRDQVSAHILGKCECESFVCFHNGTHPMYTCDQPAVTTDWVDLCTGCKATIDRPVSPEANAAFQVWEKGERERREAEWRAEELDTLPPVETQVAEIRRAVRAEGIHGTCDCCGDTLDPWAALRFKRKATKVTRRAWQGKLNRKGR